MEINKYIAPDGDYYVYHDSILKKVEVKKVFFKRVENENGEKYYKPQHYVVTHAEKDMKLPVDTKFYETVEDFKNDTPCTGQDISNLLESLRIVMPVGGTYIINRNSYMIEDGKCVKYDYLENISEMYLIRNSIEIVNGYIPDEIYGNRQEALDFSEIIVRDIDGSETVKRGVMKRLSLTEKQEALKKELEILLKKIQDEGVRIIDAYGDIYLFNANEVKEMEYEEGCLSDPDNSHQLNYSEKLRVKGACIDYTTDCLYFTLKDE